MIYNPDASSGLEYTVTGNFSYRVSSKKFSLAIKELVSLSFKIRAFCQFDFIQRKPHLKQGSGYVKAALPFSSFQRKQYLAPTIQVAKPLAVLRIPEVAPGILV